MVIRSFQHKGLKRLFEGDASKINPAIRSRCANALSLLDNAASPLALALPGFRLHELQGALKGTWSITLTANWRITFRFEGADAFDVDLIDYH
jgi:proteic killer suppression protein